MEIYNLKGGPIIGGRSVQNIAPLEPKCYKVNRKTDFPVH